MTSPTKTYAMQNDYKHRMPCMPFVCFSFFSISLNNISFRFIGLIKRQNKGNELLVLIEIVLQRVYLLSL